MEIGKSYIPASSPIAMFLTSTSWKHWTSSSRTSLHLRRLREFPRQSIPVPVHKAASIQTALNGATNFQGVTNPNARHPGNGITHSMSIPSVRPSHTILRTLETELKLTDLPLKFPHRTIYRNPVHVTPMQSSRGGVTNTRKSRHLVNMSAAACSETYKNRNRNRCKLNLYILWCLRKCD